MKVIKARQKAGFWVLLLAWLLVVAIPTVVFRWAFSAFLETRLHQEIQRVQPQLYTELQYFVHDLDETPWLENRLKEFDKQQHFHTHSIRECGDSAEKIIDAKAEHIHEKLEKHLGFQVLALFSHGADTSTVDSYVKKLPFCELKAPSATMLRRLFAIVNDQAECNLLLPSAYIPAFPQHMLANPEKNRRVYSENFVQNYLGTLANSRIDPGEIIRTIGSKTGKTGQIFLYYGLARLLDGKKKSNAGGYFAVIRLQDIPEKFIVKSAITKPFYPMFERRTGFLPRPMPFPENYSAMDLSKFVLEEDCYSLYTIAPQRQISRLAQRGTIYPGNLSLFDAQTPVIEVSCPISELEHPLARSRALIELILSIMALTGSMIFFRLYLYGFDLRLTIAVKIVAAVIFACLLPVLSLLLSSVAYDDYETNADKEKILRQLKMRNSLTQILISNAIGRYEQNTRELAADLYAIKGKSDEEHHKLLTAWCDSQPVAGVIYKKLNDSLIEHWDQSIAQIYELRARRDATWVMLNSVEEMFLASPLITAHPETVSSLLAATANNQTMSHFLLVSNAQMVPLPRVTHDTRVSFMLASGIKSGKADTAGFVIVDYDSFRLIQNLIKEISNQIACHEKDGDLIIDVAVGKVRSGHIELIDELTSQTVNRDLIIRQMESCYKLKKQIQWADRTDSTEIFSFAHFDQNLPLVILTQISRPLSASSADLWWLPIAYALLIIALVILITRAIFISPAQQLISGFEEIASGNLDHQLIIDTGDEFEVIGDECNSMTESLLEKAKLEQYVSAEILDEIRQTTEVELQPGGERIEATVLFAALRLKNAENHHSTDQLKLLNLFLGIADTICTQNGGRLDKIIGHTIMLVFRDSMLEHNHQARACTAALQIKSAFDSTNIGEKYIFSAGLAAGTMISGKIGSHNGKLDYTVIGDVVNTAARLKTHATTLPQSVIICSESMAGLQSELFTLVAGDKIRIKGKSELCRIYRLTAA